MFCFLYAGCGIQIYVTIFALYTPPYRCAVPGLMNDSYSNPPPEINFSIPLEKGFKGDLEYSQCNVFETNISKEGPGVHRAVHKKVPCKRWVYDQSIMTNTVATEMNLVCDQFPIISNLGMVPLAGLVVGGFLFGLLGDRKGRKISLSLGILMFLASVFSIPASKEPIIYGILRFIIGLACSSLIAMSYVLAMEMVTSDERSKLTIYKSFFYVAGKILNIPLAYGTKEWRLHDISASLILLPSITFLYFLEESPRWLLSVGRIEKAKEVFHRMAVKNKVPLSKMEIKENNEEKEEKKEIQNGGLKELLKSKILLIRSLIIFYNWFAMNMLYYGTMFIAEDFSSNVYISVLLTGTVEFCAYIILLLIKDRFGRKLLCAISTILSGAAYFLSAIFVIFLNDFVWMKQIFALLGILTITLNFVTIYYFTVELFPTPVRSVVFGMSSSLGKLGTIVVPYIVQGGKMLGSKIGNSLPLLVFGLIGLMAGSLALTLPETNGKKLPETIEEGENLGRKNPKDDEKVILHSDQNLNNKPQTKYNHLERDIFDDDSNRSN